MSENIEEENEKKDLIYYQAYFGKESPYYLKAIKTLEHGKASWNGYAFFFGLAWMLYRKMFLETFIVFLAMILIDLCLDPFVNTESTSYNRFLTILYAFVIGIYGNKFYLRKANKIILEAKNKFETEDQILPYLQNKGQTSIVSVIVLMAILLGLFIVILMTD